MNRRRTILATAIALLSVACASEAPVDGAASADSADAIEDLAPSPSTTEGRTTTSSSAIDASQPSSSTIGPAPQVPLDRVALDVELVADLQSPVAMAPRPGTSELYVAEQRGRLVRLAPDGETQTVLDLGDEVSGGNEQGLLGVVFSADGEAMFINYTDRSGTTVVERVEMTGDDVMSRDRILRVEQPRGNHNGGHLAFGPDGYLYIGLGDGGGGGDPGDNGQNPETLLGSMLRIDVSGAGGRYSIPPDNPFADGDGGRPEVFAWGLRNPWRYAFDRETDDLWIGDVGQDRFEEITVLRAVEGGGNGANLGWNEVEGVEPYRDGALPIDHTPPIVAYAQTAGRCSVTGGDVYRGEEIPELVGAYLFGDFCTGEIFAIDAAAGGDPIRLDIPIVSELTSFAVDGEGELYALSRDDGVFRIIAT